MQMSPLRSGIEPPTHSNGVKVESPTTGKAKARKRSTEAAQLDLQSPGASVDDDDDKEGTRIGVKRACNECRQQKLRCNVNQDPFKPCTRCQRGSLDCRIDSNFKRVGKRMKTAEMERELTELRKQVASQVSSPSIQQSPFSTSARIGPVGPISPATPHLSTTVDQYLGSEEAVASLLDLKSGGDNGSHQRSPSSVSRPLRRLENVFLTDDNVQDLFQHFFRYYHPFSPMLHPHRSPDEYYEASHLLFWVVISVAARRNHDKELLPKLSGPVTRLLWNTLADVPQNYHVVKALCLLCNWPLPISSTSSDPTFMLSGLMIQIAMQIGLHRPSHAQDFAKFRIELRAEELRDRVQTWAACNIIAQRVATGYGQPPSTHYDWTLRPSASKDQDFKLPDDAEVRLQIEMLSNKITDILYNNSTDPVGLAPEDPRWPLTKILAAELEELKQRVESIPINRSMNTLYLHATSLHLHLSSFFASPATPSYRIQLHDLYTSTTSFLDRCLNLTSPIFASSSDNPLIHYATNYILQMLIASAFVLLKLLNSSFAAYVDLEHGKTLFTRTIKTIRSISITNADLPWRLAEVLVQLWKGNGGGGGPTSAPFENREMDSSLQLKVRCRMSVSLVYDSVWRWREDFLAKGRGNLDSVSKNPTHPDSSTNDSSASSVVEMGSTPSGLPHGLPNTTGHSGGALMPGLSAATPSTASGYLNAPTPTSSASILFGSGPNGIFTPGPDNSYGEQNYDVFDPLGWTLDGFVPLPFNWGASGGLEGFSALE